MALARHSGGASVDRNTAFIGYSEKVHEGGRGSGGGSGEGCVSEDTNEGCRAWALSGECDKNPGYMKVSCALSCNVPCAAPLARREGGGGGVVVMHTSEGDIRINLRDDISPVVAGYFKSFAVEGTCRRASAGCRFYRSEAVPEPGAVDNYGGPGPPYALIQGKLAGGVSGTRSDLPREGSPVVERGYAALIGTGPDFFIAVKHHHEWGNAHTIWGEVAEEDMGPVDAVTRLPVREELWGQTHVTVLRDPLPFRMSYQPANNPGGSSHVAALRGEDGGGGGRASAGEAGV